MTRLGIFRNFSQLGVKKLDEENATRKRGNRTMCLLSRRSATICRQKRVLRTPPRSDYEERVLPFLAWHKGWQCHSRQDDWCEALSYFSLGGAQNDSGRFQRESVFGHAIFRNLKELQMAYEAVKYYASEASNEL